MMAPLLEDEETIAARKADHRRFVESVFRGKRNAREEKYKMWLVIIFMIIIGIALLALMLKNGQYSAP